MKSLQNYIFENESELENLYKPEIGSILYVVDGHKNPNGKPIKVKVKNIINTTNFGNKFIVVEFDKEVYGVNGYTFPEDSDKDTVSPDVYRHVFSDIKIQVATSLKWLEEYNNAASINSIKKIDDEIEKLAKQISDLQEQLNKKNEEKMKVMSEMIKYNEQ